MLLRLRSEDTDGYSAVQVTVGTRRANRVTKAAAGHFAKAETEAGRGLWEFRLSGDEEINVGDQLTVERFEAGQKIDVTGQSKGKGFRAVLSAGTSPCRMRLTVTHFLIVLLVLLVSVRLLVACGKARRWQDIWELSV